MPITGRLTLAATAAVLLVATGCAAPNNRVGASEMSTAAQRLDTAQRLDMAQRLDTAIPDAMSAARAPGALIGIWAPDGEYVKAFGVADTVTGIPMKTDFYSRIGSVTKTFTATAVLQLVGEGRLALDDPIATHLDGVPDGQAITVRQLTTMRSGLADYTAAEGFQAAVATDPRRSHTPQELLAWAYTLPPNFPPGAMFEYSNTNYVLLGLLVEKVSGTSLADYFDEHIFGPLKMRNTSFPNGTQFPDPHAHGYTDPVDGNGPPVDASGWSGSITWAAGSAISTLDDMRTWLPALADGALLTPELAEQRLSAASEPGTPGDFGYGMGIFTVNGWVGHNGSVPGYQTVAMYLPARQMSLVVMINTDIAVPGGGDPSETVAEAVTSVISPDHVYRL